MKKSQFKDKFDPSPEIRHLRSEVSRLEAKLKEHKIAEGHFSEAMAALMDEVHVAKPQSIVYHETKGKDAKVSSPCTHVVQFTDWHAGQRTDPAFIEEFGEYNFTVFRERVENIVNNVIKKTYAQRGSYLVPECVILGTGDWVSGDIHEELRMTNEAPCPVQAVTSGYVLGGAIKTLAEHFETVRAEILTTDNHGRITKKPQSEDGGLNNWGYVTAHVAKQFCDNIPNVTVNIHSVVSAVVRVQNMRYLIAHGDGILGTWGIPWYGIERRKQREAMARLNMPEDRRFHKIIIGHFHSALNHEHWQVGGSLSGTSAHDHKEGRHSPPHQTSWFVHPRHGEFDWTRWLA